MEDNFEFHAHKVEGGWIVDIEKPGSSRRVVTTKNNQVAKYLKEIIGEVDAAQGEPQLLAEEK